jgi:GTP-binding protein HflX
MSDTVGFIRKLPHRLIESFKSTLDEVRESDVLMHVVDVTHPNFDDQIRVVDETLGELGADDKPTLVVFNKVDALDDQRLLRALREDYPDASFISALRGIGLQQLKKDLLNLIEKDYVDRVAYVPVTEPEAIAKIHRLADVTSEDYMYAENGELENGEAGQNGEADHPQAVARMQFRASPRNDDRLRQMLEPFAKLRPVVDDGVPVEES